jgi:hypothetical protein
MIEWIRSHQRRQSTTSTCWRWSQGVSRATDETVPQEPGAAAGSNLSPEDIDSILSDYLNRSISRETYPDGCSLSLISSAMFDSFNGSQQDDTASLINSHVYQPFYDLTLLDDTEPNSSNPNVTQPTIDQDFGIDGQSSSSFNSSKLGSWVQPMPKAQPVTDSQEQESAYRERRHSPPFCGNGVMGESASPFASHFLAEDHSRLYIKKGLLKIYHDSLEGALSCWLIERNCPYTSSPFVDGRDAWSSK